MRKQRLSPAAAFIRELPVLEGADVDEHVEPRTLDAGFERQQGDAEVAGAGVVEAADQGSGQCDRLIAELHHLHRGPGAAFQAFLDRRGTGGFLLVGLFGHGECIAHDHERVGVAVHHVDKLCLQSACLLLNVGGMLGVFGVLFIIRKAQ